MAARELRYAWFAEIMQKNGFKTLVTAHHADDDLETFLINLSRGTGIEGLTGIPEKTDSIARPLLAFSKEQINAYADGENIQWREDRSNADTKYLRNNIRHRILPLFKELNPSFLENFRETQHYLAQTAAIADDGIRQIRGEIFLQEGKTLKIPVRALKKLKPSQGYLYGLFKEYGFTEWNDVEHLLQAMSGKEVRSKTHRLVKDRDFLLLAEIKAVESGAYEIWEHETEIEKPVPMEIEMVNTMTETGEHILYVPKKALKYPLTLRKWEEGDYFYPFGMQGKKKLSKFFKDEKIDVITKEGQWLLCSEGEIVWVVGRRADERFKITEGTEQILKFELKS
jgi:tRNA(Ile)-lysidine synthase